MEKNMMQIPAQIAASGIAQRHLDGTTLLRKAGTNTLAGFGNPVFKLERGWFGNSCCTAQTLKFC